VLGSSSRSSDDEISKVPALSATPAPDLRRSVMRSVMAGHDVDRLSAKRHRLHRVKRFDRRHGYRTGFARSALRLICDMPTFWHAARSLRAEHHRQL
jgi:hypothetical protein